jgi:hypothetical protein
VAVVLGIAKIVVLLAGVEAGWMVADGTRALVTEDYVRRGRQPAAVCSLALDHQRRYLLAELRRVFLILPRD